MNRETQQIIDDLHTYGNYIATRRNDAGLVCDVSDCQQFLRGSPSEILDIYVAFLGLKPISDDWLEINQREADNLLISILSRDLAYNAPAGDEQSATVLARRFLHRFDPDARYFTNGTIALPHQQRRPATHVIISGYSPLTEATFDTGVVALDTHQIGIIWVWDED
jgi:hypothetical protein